MLWCCWLAAKMNIQPVQSLLFKSYSFICGILKFWLNWDWSNIRKNKSVFSFHQRTMCVTLLAFAAERRLCSNQSISFGHLAHSGKPVALECGSWMMGCMERQTDGQIDGCSVSQLNSCTTTTTATVLQPLYRSTCVSWHLQLRTGGFRWCKVLLPTCPCWWQRAHLYEGEDAGVLLNSVTYTVSLLYYTKFHKWTNKIWKASFVQAGLL